MNWSGFQCVIILALATAAISVTMAKARIFASAREWIAARNGWLGELAACSYCTSHWVAIALVAVYRPVLVRQWIVIDLFVSVFVVVALASLVSGAISRLIPFQVDRKTATSLEVVEPKKKTVY
ncbi:MAG: DUF1360 domain-containing protein [Candidatus Kerfeldbacteria bacterium]|nr:DUF1360 domain-containing protein [Candidatus Kerfeldbacteria bacterium]